eukprot:611586-Prymnesium_polylepis.1
MPCWAHHTQSPAGLRAVAAWRRRAAMRRGGGAARRPDAQAEAQVHDHGADAALAVHRVPARGRGRAQAKKGGRRTAACAARVACS